MGYRTLSYNVVRQTIQGPLNPAVITFPGPPPGQVWLVTGISVASTSSAQPSALIYDQELPSSLNAAPVVPVPCQGTVRGWLDFDDQGSPLIIMGGDPLNVLWWPALESGAVASARVQYELAVLDGAAAAHPVLGA